MGWLVFLIALLLILLKYLCISDILNKNKKRFDEKLIWYICYIKTHRANEFQIFSPASIFYDLAKQ